MARGDLAIDFDDSGWEFLESPGFLLAVFALAVLWYGAERSAPNDDPRSPLRLAALGLGAVLGALLFAGSLAAGGREAWPGLVAGAACALLAWVSLGALFARAAKRLGSAGGGALGLYAEAAALALALVAILLPPAAFLALAGFLLLLVKGRDDGDRKYAGLRVLR